jgi:hypothetical protein
MIPSDGLQHPRHAQAQGISRAEPLASWRPLSFDGWGERELYLRLALHYRELVANMRKAIATKTVTACCCRSPFWPVRSAKCGHTGTVTAATAELAAKPLRCGTCGHRHPSPPETIVRARRRPSGTQGKPASGSTDWRGLIDGYIDGYKDADHR